MTSFRGFAKIPRLWREVIVTEKIDGTNASVFIGGGVDDPTDAEPLAHVVDPVGGSVQPMWAGSRTRWVYPQADNFGFARWVVENQLELVKLGPGHHFGEWWGRGIQRGYGLDERRFSLFNTSRWRTARPACCHVVPVLAEGTNMFAAVQLALNKLAEYGSIAAPDVFLKPEGIVVYHTVANTYFKVTLENDAEPKTRTERA